MTWELRLKPGDTVTVTAGSETRLIECAQANEPPPDEPGSLQDLLETLQVSMRAYNCIQANVDCPAQLLSRTARDMLVWHNCGRLTVGEIAACLDRAGLKHQIRDRGWNVHIQRAYERVNRESDELERQLERARNALMESPA